MIQIIQQLYKFIISSSDTLAKIATFITLGILITEKTKKSSASYLHLGSYSQTYDEVLERYMCTCTIAIKVINKKHYPINIIDVHVYLGDELQSQRFNVSKYVRFSSFIFRDLPIRVPEKGYIELDIPFAYPKEQPFKPPKIYIKLAEKKLPIKVKKLPRKKDAYRY